MAVHSKNKALVCKVFPSSLGSMAIRWFDGLLAGSIDSFKELTCAFGSRFITCSRVSWPLDSLLSMIMREGETLKTYSDRYLEMFNEIDGDFDDVAIRTFKVGLPAEHDLRKSLTKKPVRSVRRLIDRIDEYKRVEEDQQQGKGKAKVISQDRRDFRSDRYNNNRPQRDFTGQSGSIANQVVNTVFRELVHQARAHHRRLQNFVEPSGTVGQRWVMSVARPPAKASNPKPKRARTEVQPALSFLDEDKAGTIQPHDDALVVTLRIGGFDGKVVVPIGQIRLPVQAISEMVEVDFILVDAYSPYTAIVARP
ncbi:uncharacterized protein LOC142635173 [Castanea sativa]|uniref:uncharacterized protein LOC142635173 n=1 Tax=Castanea sativa TaxID=21020 RepID=UPI003F64B010